MALLNNIGNVVDQKNFLSKNCQDSTRCVAFMDIFSFCFVVFLVLQHLMPFSYRFVRKLVVAVVVATDVAIAVVVVGGFVVLVKYCCSSSGKHVVQLLECSIVFALSERVNYLFKLQA